MKQSTERSSTSSACRSFSEWVFEDRGRSWARAQSGWIANGLAKMGMIGGRLTGAIEMARGRSSANVGGRAAIG